MEVQDIIALTAAQAIAAIERGRPRPGRAVRGLPRARRRGRAQRVHLGRRAPARRHACRRAAARRAARGQGPLLHRGGPEPVGLEDPRGLPAAVHRDRRGAPAGGRRGAPRQDEPGRVRDGLLERELRLRAGAQPVGPHARPGRLVRRQRRGRRRRARAVGARHRHRRLDPPARRAVRHRRPEADLRHRLALRHDRLRLLARPGRPAHARRHRRGAALSPHGRHGPERRDLGRPPGGDPLPTRRASRRAAARRARPS